jgi:UDP-N-acetylenolpyruvoylglucosamine reductase
MAESVAKRRSSQPVAASAGCIFKNPSTIPAGKLIEELGLKNFSVGGARVSEIHGNFIVNDGGATSADVLTLIKEIQTAAERTRGLHLETEVQIVGVDL